jgi:hypothetical protein
MLQHQERTQFDFNSAIAGAGARPWSARRKLLTIAAAALLAWMLWGAAGLLIWRSLRP